MATAPDGNTEYPWGPLGGHRRLVQPHSWDLSTSTSTSATPAGSRDDRRLSPGLSRATVPPAGLGFVLNGAKGAGDGRGADGRSADNRHGRPGRGRGPDWPDGRAGAGPPRCAGGGRGPEGGTDPGVEGACGAGPQHGDLRPARPRRPGAVRGVPGTADADRRGPAAWRGQHRRVAAG